MSALPAKAKHALEAERLHKKEMIRIHKLWSETKKELKEKGKQLEEVNHRWESEVRDREASLKADVERERSYAENLRIELQEAKKLAAKLKDEKEALRAELSRSKSQTDNTSVKLEMQTRATGDQEAKVARLLLEIRRLRSEGKENEKRMESEKRQVEAKLDSKTKIITLLRDRLQSLEDDVRGMKDLHQRNSEKRVDLKQNVDGLSSENLELRRQLDSARTELTRLRELAGNCEGLQQENVRLTQNQHRYMRLLSTTTQFSKYFRTDENGELTYIPDAASLTFDTSRSALRAGVKVSRHAVLENDRAVVPRRELDYWIPRAAFDHASKFKHAVLPHVQIDVFYAFFVQLNEIWREREKLRLARVRSKCRAKVQHLRRLANDAHALRAAVDFDSDEEEEDNNQTGRYVPESLQYGYGAAEEDANAGGRQVLRGLQTAERGEAHFLATAEVQRLQACLRDLYRRLGISTLKTVVTTDGDETAGSVLHACSAALEEMSSELERLRGEQQAWQMRAAADERRQHLTTRLPEHLDSIASEVVDIYDRFGDKVQALVDSYKHYVGQLDPAATLFAERSDHYRTDFLDKLERNVGICRRKLATFLTYALANATQRESGANASA